MTKLPFTIEQMRSFLAVAQREHVSRAAEELHLTQGAVTQQLRNFERALGVRLLERSGRGVKLTDAGRSLATSCRAALRGLELFAETAQAVRSLEAGSLHIGASPTCAGYYLPPLLAAFTQIHPRVQLDVTIDPSSQINEQIRAGVLDCGLIEGQEAADLTNLAIGSDELVLVCKPDHPLARAERLTTALLAGHRYLGRGAQWGAESTAQRMIGEAYDLSPALNLGHPEYVRAAAVAGLGYAALPLQAVEADLANGTLKRLTWPSRKRTIRAVRRAAPGGPTLEEFWLFLARGVDEGSTPAATNGARGTA